MKQPKIIAMANCGFPGQCNFKVLKILFKRLARNIQTELIAEIYRDEGPLLTINDKNLKDILKDYKKTLEKAGEEIVLNLKLKKETQINLQKPLIPYDLYIKKHNAFFLNL